MSTVEVCLTQRHMATARSAAAAGGNRRRKGAHASTVPHRRDPSGDRRRGPPPAPSGAAVAHADAIRIRAGHGESTDDYGFSVQLDRLEPIHEFERWTVTGDVELGAGEFQGHRGALSPNTVHALAAFRKLRGAHAAYGRVQPFVDFGSGAGGLSEVTINGDRHFSGSFQFTELLRSGVRFGGGLQYELAIGVPHFSNAGLSRPNDSITYAGVTAAWYWRSVGGARWRARRRARLMGRAVSRCSRGVPQPGVECGCAATGRRG